MNDWNTPDPVMQRMEEMLQEMERAHRAQRHARFMGIFIASVVAGILSIPLDLNLPLSVCGGVVVGWLSRFPLYRILK